ncbi:MAG: sugar kinase [Sphingorhabdus sp.]
MTILCFGEMLIRLAPATDAGLAETEMLKVEVAGAEANVAISLSSFGTPTRMATVVPDNALGRRALRTLGSWKVDARYCLTRKGRMGLYFIGSPRDGREGDFFYDRAASAFACNATAIDWNAALHDVDWLHISGLTAALGDVAVSAMRNAIGTARAKGAAISFDCNFRPQLWEGRRDEARTLFREFANAATLVFANEWDAQLILGDEVGQQDSMTMLGALPSTRWIASTVRTFNESGSNLGAVLSSRHGTTEVCATTITPFVERIGAGDAFAAALLHALASGWDDEVSLRFAHRACLMKHSRRGDYSTFSAEDVLQAVADAPPTSAH